MVNGKSTLLREGNTSDYRCGSDKLVGLYFNFSRLLDVTAM
jgi:hypothetical protein